MDQPLEVTNIKNELIDSTSSDRLEIPTEIQVSSIKQENDCLVQSEIHIKTEPPEEETEYPVTASSSLEMCSYNNIKFTTIKIEHKDLRNEIMQDPLDIRDEIKDKINAEEYSRPEFYEEASEISIKTERIKGKEKQEFTEIYEDDVHRTESDYQEQLVVRNETVDKNRKHTCHVCNKRFIHKWHLDRHLLIHFGSMLYTCNVCEKAFTQKGNLARHMLIHSGEKPHICDVCMKAFSVKASLNSHMLVHSGLRPFSCNECDLSFAHKSNLIRHKRIHTDDKPFACDVCSKLFTQKSHLIRHKVVHTRDKPFACNVCTKAYATKRNLNRHKKNHLS